MGRRFLISGLSLAAVVMLAACGPGIIAGDNGKPCGASRCQELGKNCGEVAIDGCGPIDCGQCLPPETCGGAGIANVCAAGDCTPTTCAAQGATCGTISDGCAGVLDCGPCLGDKTPPSVPAGLQASASSCTSVELSWSPATDDGDSGLKAYLVYDDAGLVREVLAPATSLTVTALAPATTHSFSLSAVDNAGNESERSSPVSVATPACRTADCTKFVSKDGNDNNPGTEGEPWLTLRKAGDTATAGDTVCVQAGTYSERLKPANSGSNGSYIKFIAIGKVILDARDLPQDYAVINITLKDWMWVEGFEIFAHSDESAAIATGRKVPVDYSDPANLKCSSGILIKDNVIHGASALASGIRIGGSGSATRTVGCNSRIIIDGNVIDDTDIPVTSPGGPELISVADTDQAEIKNNRIINSTAIAIDLKGGVTNTTVHHNTIESPGSAGIKLDGYSFYEGYIDIFNNVIRNARSTPIQSKPIIVYLEYGIGDAKPGSIEHVRIFNNLLSGSLYYGIVVGGGTQQAMTVNNLVKDVQVIGNTIVDNPKGGILLAGGENAATLENITIRNNLLQGNGTDNGNKDNIVKQYQPSIPNLVIENNHYAANNGNNTGTGFTTGDPLFVSATDFHLQSNSPAIDKGTATGAPAFDHDGNTRPVRGGFDIGAFESCAGSECVPAKIPSATGPIRIMPLGDSITAGWYSYRNGLWTSLTNSGHEIDFVGSQSAGDLPDKDHEGHSGMATAQVEPEVEAWVAEARPAYVLLHIGTNDVSNALFGGRTPPNAFPKSKTFLISILDKIFKTLPAASVMVATIIPQRDCMYAYGHKDDPNYYRCGNQALVLDYNAMLKEVVAGKASAGKPVHLVDMFSEAGIDPAADLSDPVHPNKKGADKMANTWSTHLETLLAGPEP